MPGPSSYRTVLAAARGEITVQRSRFVATVARAETEQDVRAEVEHARREHWSARHHCSAYVLGPEGAARGSGDDGEPSGTAGAPILALLLGEELSDVVVVVSRHFGGVLLGTGGLTRAYADAARAALGRAEIVERVLRELYDVSLDHALVGRLEHQLRARGVQVLGVRYDDRAHLRLAVPARARTVAVVRDAVAELTQGEGALVHVGEDWVDQALPGA